MKQNSRKSPTHLAVRRHGLTPIFALVGFTEPPLAAVGWAGESILRTGGSGEPSHESGRYVKNGRWRYSPRCPLDIRAAPPGVQGRYDLPKGSSWQLFPHPGADAESPDHPRFLLSSELGFLYTKNTARPLSGPSLQLASRFPKRNGRAHSKQVLGPRALPPRACLLFPPRGKPPPDAMILFRKLSSAELEDIDMGGERGSDSPG